MTEQQDVLSPQRRRRHGPTILLGSIPVAVALTALLTAGTWAATPQSTLASDNEGKISAPTVSSDPLPSIIAPAVTTSGTVAAPAHNVTVTLPPPPKPVVAPAATTKQSGGTNASASTSGTTTKRATSTQTTTKTPAAKKSTSVSFEKYCSSPSSPYTASGGAKALLSAANKERARIGIKQLSWSSSLASAATKWSQTLAAKDSKTDALADALSHNPNRPGAENVAVSYVSTGLSQGGAISRAHTNWMNSNGHCKNIMNPAYSTMGAGAASTTDGSTWYTTQNFR